MPVPRLKKRANFLAVAATKKVIRTPTMHVQLRERLADEDPGVALRIGFTATRRIGNAVTRNRARRRLCALVNQIAPTLKLPYPLDLVLIATLTTATAPFSALVRDFFHALAYFSLLEKAP
jgi:ribonuclease P protein component